MTDKDYVSYYIVVACTFIMSRFRVVDEQFVDTNPSGPDDTTSMPPPSTPGLSAPITPLADAGSKKAPYTLVVSCSLLVTFIYYDPSLHNSTQVIALG